MSAAEEPEHGTVCGATGVGAHPVDGATEAWSGVETGEKRAWGSEDGRVWTEKVEARMTIYHKYMHGSTTLT